VGPGIKTGLEILIDNPAQLGSDMVCNAVAAIARYPKPIVIFDLGTATTASVINEKGQFLGGAIAPGVGTSLEALSGRAAQLPHIALEAPPRVIGTNTRGLHAVGHRLRNGLHDRRMIDRIEEETAASPRWIATGGCPGRFAGICAAG
jgi:type III pantothenate kinase